MNDYLKCQSCPKWIRNAAHAIERVYIERGDNVYCSPECAIRAASAEIRREWERVIETNRAKNVKAAEAEKFQMVRGGKRAK